MIKAFDINKKWVTVNFTGQKAICPICGEDVFGKIYLDKANHFSHYSKSNCTANTGIISDWHLHWQSKFENKEILFPDKGLRADVILDNKTVIEFQHSDIQINEIKRREDGYKKMIWLFDCLQFSQNIFQKNEFVYWDYPKKNWLFFTKPAFFHIEKNKIVQFRNIGLFYSENKGGYSMPVMKSDLFRDLTVNEFIDECYMMDNYGRNTFEICENIEILKTIKL